MVFDKMRSVLMCIFFPHSFYLKNATALAKTKPPRLNTCATCAERSLGGPTDYDIMCRWEGKKSVCVCISLLIFYGLIVTWKLYLQGVHQKRRDFVCPHCGKKFLINSKLTEHLRIHTGEKPFKCFACDYRSNRHGNVRLHVKKVHKILNPNNEVNTKHFKPST